MIGDCDGVAHVAPRIRFGAMVSHVDDLRSVMVVGGDPQTEAELMRSTGTWPKADTSNRGLARPPWDDGS